MCSDPFSLAVVARIREIQPVETVTQKPAFLNEAWKSRIFP